MHENIASYVALGFVHACMACSQMLVTRSYSYIARVSYLLSDNSIFGHA